MLREAKQEKFTPMLDGLEKKLLSQPLFVCVGWPGARVLGYEDGPGNVNSDQAVPVLDSQRILPAGSDWYVLSEYCPASPRRWAL